MKFRITEPTFFLHKDRKPGEEMEAAVGPHRNEVIGGQGLHRVPQFVELPTQSKARMSVIDRIKAKALQARSIAPKAIAEFEADLDGLIAEGPKLASARLEAVGRHLEAFSGIHGELDGLKSAIDILSNGAPSDPLPASNGASDEQPK